MAPADDPPLHQIHSSAQQSLAKPVPVPLSPPQLQLDHGRHVPNNNTNTPDVARDLDKLVHRLNRKPILQDPLQWHLLDKERSREETREIEEGLHFQYEGPDHVFSMPNSMPLPPSEPTAALHPIPEFSMQCDPSPSTMSPLYDPPRSPRPYQLDRPPLDAPSEDRKLVKASDAKRLRRGTEKPLHKSASNLRMLGLMTGMIENGVQCNVQSSTPSSPTKATSTALTLPTAPGYIEPQDPIESHLLSGRMQLEVDPGFSELDEDTLLNDNLTLRNASTPSGIRKFGFLRYRSSSEAAQACKNMKKSVPRMRRRRRTNSTATSESSVPPTSQSNTTMA
ncbi:hypothetical protein F4802DRAFT_129097 [Xylaria palmicola]|nr:hypothetical protein F4802DRAFT_129097 [Xylaria palmicola]